MDRIQFIQHKGKQILHLNFTDTKADEVTRIVQEATTLIAAQPVNSLRTLTDVTGMSFNKEASEAMKEFARHNKPYVCAAAVIGVTGLKQIIYNAVIKFTGRNLVVFDSSEKAKDWLADQ